MPKERNFATSGHTRWPWAKTVEEYLEAFIISQGGSITVHLVSSFTGLYYTKQEKLMYLVATESRPVNLGASYHGDRSINIERV